MTIQKAAILGATGPIGIYLAEALHADDTQFRVVSRSSAHLERSFPGTAERVTADLLHGEQVRRAIEGCDVVFHCIGFAGSQMHQHRIAAGHVADAIRASGARCVHVSSYWAYMPLVGNPLNEDHPRRGGPDWVRHRRAAEDTLREAGAAIANLPDFYGPHVHTSTLQQPLAEAARGKTMNWIGSTETDREYAFVPDAAATIVALARRDEAYGEHWLIPTAGPLNGRRAAEIASEVMAPKIKVRGIPSAVLRTLALFNEPLRGMVPLLPEYMKSLSYETLKIERLLGSPPVTPYEEGIRRTLDWLRGQVP